MLELVRRTNYINLKVSLKSWEVGDPEFSSVLTFHHYFKKQSWLSNLGGLYASAVGGASG